MLPAPPWMIKVGLNVAGGVQDMVLVKCTRVLWVEKADRMRNLKLFDEVDPLDVLV